MVAPDQAAADQRLPREREVARVKAAAWAWYQRSGGSIAAGAGRSEAFATRCSARLSPSRFQREAAMRARMRSLASQASDSTLLSSTSSMDKLSASSSSFSHCTATFGDGDEITSTDGAVLNSDHENPNSTHEQLSLDLLSMDPAACWDCGSSLFDSFELVAMSKKLDAELLHEPNIEAQHEEDARFDHNQETTLSLCDTPHNGAISPSPPTSPPATAPAHHGTYDIFDNLLSAPDKQSKQAVYDMFCHYGDAANHITKQSCKRASPVDAACRGAGRKHKLRPGSMSFHGLAKALHSITHLHLHTTGGSVGGGGHEAVQDHHHHHHRHHSPLPQASMAAGIKGQGTITSSGELCVYDDAALEGPQSKSRHIHHHHHHHYHYLFHSDDDFRLQPLDKSLMVAAAGLRSNSKASPHALSSYLESPARGDFPVDSGRKWGECGTTMPSPNFRY